MTADSLQPQITVLDAGGQYCHLIARRVRELGVFSEVRASETPADELTGRKGIIISGGPSSVSAPDSPTVDPAIFALGAGVLGICYGQQLMAHLLHGTVRKGAKGEYGAAVLNIHDSSGVLAGLSPRENVWMSHFDQVEKLPAGFTTIASTSTCEVAAIADPARRFYGVQFHPEVVHTAKGMEVLSNFLFPICGCEKDWDPRGRIASLEREIQAAAAGRNIFFFVSGGVDSSVAYRLCLRALGKDRVHGAYVDTGLMREGETEFVREALGVEVVDARQEFLDALSGATDPESKRHIIGEQFVAVQERVLQSGHYLDGEWILGQGTIYPDTIESGGTAKADLIKTHHNRVAGIQKLIDENRIIEPLTSFYKDEVREVGAALGLPDELLHRHPFPGPGLAIRLLCAAEAAPIVKMGSGRLVPVRSVGVQGDERTYRAVLALDKVIWNDSLLEQATHLINRHATINRVVALCGTHHSMETMQVAPGRLDRVRLERLRRADAIVRRLSHESGFDGSVWQFPVVVIPCGAGDRPDSVVLRPVHSVDGMTAQSVLMEDGLRDRITAQLLAVPGIAAVFYDLTHKPPGTIEWE
ncbi:MAG: glutamine-hydrolyzing GMP synthase [Acidobacteriia bacterium]|nr:glutamine-hydrolyzing GMP synthase [Terriglobia bacterium]